MTDDVGAAVLRARGVRVERAGARSRFLRRRAAPTRVVQGLDVDVRAGDVLWVVGAPGEGATEVGQVLAGELAVTAGIVELNGRALAVSRGRRRTRTQRQVVWLDSDATVTLDPKRTVLEVVAAAAAGSSRSVTSEHQAQARDLLVRLGLGAETAETRAGALSAADARLVDAARALAPQPRVVVYRSPPPADLGSDPVWEVLIGLRERSSTALVITSAALPARLDPGDRVLVMCGVSVVEVLTHGDLSHPLHPYTRTLAGFSVRATASAPRARAADEPCPFRVDCPRAKPRCATEVPRLARPLGATHEVACHFPEDPRRPQVAEEVAEVAHGLEPGAGPVQPVVASGRSDEPTAREFAEG